MTIGALTPRDWLLAALLVGCALTDARVGRIYNVVTYPAILLGLASAGMGLGPSFGAAVAGCLAGGLALYALFALGWMGGGDVKLMAAVGAFVGFPGILTALFYSIFAGGVCAAIILVWRGQSRPALKDLSIAAACVSGFDGVSLGAIPPRGGAFPFGAAIAAGTIATLILGRIG